MRVISRYKYQGAYYTYTFFKSNYKCIFDKNKIKQSKALIKIVLAKQEVGTK